jgi:hypothetical protein
MRDVGRLRRPGRYGAGPGHREERRARWLRRGAGIEVEQSLQNGEFARHELARGIHQVQVLDRDGAHGGLDSPECREQALYPEAGECWRAPEPQHQAVSALRPGRCRTGTG